MATAKKKTTARRKLRAEPIDLDARRVARDAAELQREERMLWGIAAAAGVASGLDTDQAAAAADGIADCWRRRYA